MTTRVTVTTHDWPVVVSEFPLHGREPLADGKWKELGRVEPHSSYEFCVHDGRDLLVQELPIPTKPAD